MNKNTSKNMGIVAVAGFSIQLIFKLMGSSNRAVIIQGIILIVLCIILAVYMYSATKKILGNKLSIVGAILLVAAGSAISFGYIMTECYHQLYKEYETLCDHLIIGSFCALMIFFIIAAIIDSYKKNK